MEKEPALARMRIVVNRVEPARIECARAADDPVNLITLGQQQFRQIGTVLPRNAGDKCSGRHALRARHSKRPPVLASLEKTDTARQTASLLFESSSKTR